MPKRPRDTPPEKFVADPSDIGCPICLEPFWQPTRAEPCGHVACRGCIGRLDQCPLCRAEVQSTTPCDAAVSRRSHGARVSCSTCSWSGTRKQQVTQAHVMCPVVCKQQAEEKMAAVMRDVYPRAEFTRYSLVSKINSMPSDQKSRDYARNWNGVQEVFDTKLFVKQMIALYCPNLKEMEQHAIGYVTHHSDVIQSVSGPSSCLLWTLFDACCTSNTELAVGLALRALAIPPTSPDAFPAGLDWQYACLLIAAQTNHSTLRELLRNGLTVPNPFTESLEWGWFSHLIECPTKFGDLDCIRLLVEKSPFIDFEASGVSAMVLKYVVEYDRFRWIGGLVNEIGCDVNATLSGSNEWNPIYPLFRAVETRKPNCVSELISLGANLNQANRDTGYTALHQAVSSSDVECLDILLAAGADINVVSRYGITILSLAAGLSSLEPMKALVAAGAKTNEIIKFSLENVRRVPFSGGSICAAVMSGNIPMVEYLHSLIPVPDLRAEFGLTAKEIKVMKKNSNESSYRQLVSRSMGTEDVVAIAVLSNNWDVVELLVKKGYYVGIKAVHAAIRTRNIMRLEYTLQPRFGHNLDEKLNKSTALQLAASRGDAAMAELLLDLGATLDITAEEAAVAKGHIDVGYYLHERRMAAAGNVDA